MSSVGPNEAACFGPRTKLSKACNSPPDQNRLPETVLGPFQDRTKSAVTVRPNKPTKQVGKQEHSTTHMGEHIIYDVQN